VAGYVMNRLGHLPQPGEFVDVMGSRLTVLELDGRRIARLRVAPTPSDAPAASSDVVPTSAAPDPPNGATRAAEAAG
jgi:putative hemolysin